MDLRKYLRGKLERGSKSLTRRLTLVNEALDKFDDLNLRQADYSVTLNSMWEDEGEKSTTTNYNGTLKNAIKKAEEEFKKTNERSDVQAHYSVEVMVGLVHCRIPEEFYMKLKYKKLH